MAAGRPKKYSEKEEFEKKVNDYFNWCDSQTKEIVTDKGIKTVYKPYTVSGLCLYLNITRETLCKYQEKEEFSDTIKIAKHRIENWIEEHALTREIDNTSAIFNLKNNFGWKDKQEIESNNVNKNENTNINISDEQFIADLKAKYLKK